jgi:hypothetical protein
MKAKKENKEKEADGLQYRAAFVPALQTEISFFVSANLCLSAVPKVMVSLVVLDHCENVDSRQFCAAVQERKFDGKGRAHDFSTKLAH